jgi:antitoxin (DNA-binding transcriptional repressor) of toxin-antitoxin stability system
MKIVTISDLHRRWPRVETALQTEKEILITRNGNPVAKLMLVSKREIGRLNFKKLTRLSFDEHQRFSPSRPPSLRFGATRRAGNCLMT